MPAAVVRMKWRRRWPGRRRSKYRCRRLNFYVLGADQVASCEGQLFGKPGDFAQAERQLAFLAGRRHRLHSAVALAFGGAILFETVAHADLLMRAVDQSFVKTYLKLAGEARADERGRLSDRGPGRTSIQ